MASLAYVSGEAAPATWLYRVVTNAALAQLRQRPPTVPIAEDTEERLWNVDDPDVPERAVLRAEEVAAVHRAVAGLEPSQQVPLVLREFEGLSYEEIAAVLEVSVSAVRSRVHRARQTLLMRLKGIR